jgi:regulator of protease activity HflC (stomatin/prohibitin superfamily)
MAHIRRVGMLGHLRAEPNQHILHYRKGKLARQGPGLAYWFNQLNAAVAQIPAEDIETTFLLKERTRDLQEVTVQVVLTYRCVDPRVAASRVNFSLALETGAWIEKPLERLAGLWSQRAQDPARLYLASVPLTEAVQLGAERIRRAIAQAVTADPEIEAMGLALVGVQVVRVAPSAELEKALATPTREALQQKADQAVFERRALAVEKERAIKENELATQIELARRQEGLIAQEGANLLREAQTKAAADRERVTAEAETQQIAAKAAAQVAEVKAEGDAKALRLLADAKAEGERRRVEVWRDATGRVLLGLALQEFAGKVETIGHLNITPNLFGDAFREFLTGQADV